MAGNLTELDDIVFYIKHLTTSDKFTKLLYNKDDDPLRTNLPAGSNYDLIAYKNLLPYMKNIDISEEGENVYVCVYFGMGKKEQGTKYFKSNYLFVDIYAHNDLWKIDTGIRTYSLMQEIDKLLNSRTIEHISNAVGLEFIEYRPLPSVNVKYAGYGIVYKRVDLGMQGCDTLV